MLLLLLLLLLFLWQVIGMEYVNIFVLQVTQ
jgi:hypothetical protein